jgi:hypothetical protein
MNAEISDDGTKISASIAIFLGKLRFKKKTIRYEKPTPITFPIILPIPL